MVVSSGAFKLRNAAVAVNNASPRRAARPEAD
jgi:hypothetical protein